MKLDANSQRKIFLVDAASGGGGGVNRGSSHVSVVSSSLASTPEHKSKFNLKLFFIFNLTDQLVWLMKINVLNIIFLR